MDKSAFTVSILSLLAIGALPLWFSRPDGRLNLRWFLTALPFFASASLLVAGVTGALRSQLPQGWATGLDAVGCVASVASLALLFATWGTHRTPLSLWHQENDAPRGIVTVGPYAMIRHPFYASFLLAEIGAVLVLPGWPTLLSLAYALIALTVTAVREERRLSASAFGAEYQAYMRRTGRFVPRPAAPRPSGRP
jgi:protein-S-isoprenylcysteine O-methyltransferase Ste14